MFTRASPTRSLFYLLLAVIVVSLPAFMRGASKYRTYAWMLCWTAVLVQFVFWLLSEHPSPRVPHGLLLRIAGSASVAVAIMLHFIVGVLVSSLVGVMLVALWRAKAWPALAAVLGPALVAWVTMLVLAAWQFSHVGPVLDYSWIETTTPQALALGGLMLGQAAIANPVASAMSLFGRDAPHDDPVAQARRRQRLFMAVVGFSLAASMVALIAVNAAGPLIVERYLAVWQVMFAALIAAAAEPAVARSRRGAYVVLAVGAISVATAAAGRAPRSPPRIRSSASIAASTAMRSRTRGRMRASNREYLLSKYRSSV